MVVGAGSHLRQKEWEAIHGNRSAPTMGVLPKAGVARLLHWSSVAAALEQRGCCAGVARLLRWSGAAAALE